MHPLCDPTERANAVAERADRLRDHGTELNAGQKNASQEFRQLLGLLNETLAHVETPRLVAELSKQVEDLKTALNKAQGFAGRNDVSVTPPKKRSSEPN